MRVKRLFVPFLALVAVLTMVSFPSGIIKAATIINVPSDYSTIQAAIDAASAGDTIQVDAGFYAENIMLKNGVTLIGAGLGLERTYLTGSDAGPIVTAINIDLDTRLDGFNISRGNAENGGGMYNQNASPLVSNCIFSVHSASQNGGAMYNENSSPIVTDCYFFNNLVDNYGGAVYNIDSSPTFINCDFTMNSATWGGGGMYNLDSSPTLTGCIFKDNAASSGGGLYNRDFQYDSLPLITDCYFLNNSANYGGGIYNRFSSPVVTNSRFEHNLASRDGGAINNYECGPQIGNCIFYDNRAGNDGGVMINYTSHVNLTNCTFSNNSAYSGRGMYNDWSQLWVTNCILWDGGNEIYNIDSTADITYCDVQTGYGGEGNIDADPMFEDPVIGIFKLQAGSPCIDAGTNVGAPSHDIEGNIRPVDGDSDGTATTDIGAYEYQIPIYTITASAGLGGSISPSGTVMVNHGASQTFTITPDDGYHVSDVLVDGSSVGALTSYEFTNVTADHFIECVFELAGTTPPGDDVIVTPVDPATGDSPVTIIFDQVSEGGTTSVTTSGTGTPPPDGFKLGTPPTYFTIETTATYEGSITICIDYSGISYGNENDLRLFHETATGWDNITDPGYPDTVNKRICGTIDSLSLFAIFEAEPPVAVDDHYTMDEDTVLNVPAPGIVANDTIPGGGPVTVVLTSEIQNGTMTINNDGSFTWVPRQDFSGTYTFTYKLDNGVTQSSNAYVRITVNVTEPPLSLQNGQVTLKDIVAPFGGEYVPISWGWELAPGSGAYIFYGYDEVNDTHYLVDTTQCHPFDGSGIGLEFGIRYEGQVYWPEEFAAGMFFWKEGDLPLPLEILARSRSTGTDPVWLAIITAYDRDTLSFMPLLGYGDWEGDVSVPLDQNQYLRLRFLLSDFNNTGDVQVKSIYVAWSTWWHEPPDFAYQIKLRDYDSGEAITVATFNEPSQFVTSYDVSVAGFVSDHFYVEIWPTAGSFYVVADADAPHHSMGEASLDGGNTWGAINYPELVDLGIGVAVGPPTDSDGDGIMDMVDTDPSISSRDFSDGNTSGSIISLDQGISILVTDAPNPTEGVRIIVSGPEDSIAPIRIDGDGAGIFELPPGEYVYTTYLDNHGRPSLSYRIKKIIPDKEVKFHPTGSRAIARFRKIGDYNITKNSIVLEVGGGGLAEVEYSIGDSTTVIIIDSGGSVELNELLTAGGVLKELVVTTGKDSPEGSVVVNGLFLSPGTSMSPIVPIDIKPGSDPNSINLGAGGTVPVAILSTATFNATTVEPTSVTLASLPVKLKGKGTPMAATEDVNGDELLDLVVHVSTDAFVVSEVDQQAILTGKTFDGIQIMGVDTVRVVP